MGNENTLRMHPLPGADKRAFGSSDELQTTGEQPAGCVDGEDAVETLPGARGNREGAPSAARYARVSSAIFSAKRYRDDARRH